MSFSHIAALGVLALVGAGCGLADDGSVSIRGRVVDSVTGQPVDPGIARVTVSGASFLGPTETVLSELTESDGRFDLSESVRDGVGEFSVTVGSDAQIDYPGTDADADPFGYDVFRTAYFNETLPYRKDVGTVELIPTCMAVGDIQLSRPLAPSEQLSVRIGSDPEVLLPSRLVANGFRFEGSPGPDYVVPDSIRLLAVGGRPARLEWEINQYNPPTGNGGGVFASGAVSLDLCPRHGVLRYSATLPLP